MSTEAQVPEAQVQRQRRDALKGLIRRLHEGDAVEEVRESVVRMLGEIPYDEVVAAEQELISEGLPTEEVLRLCDLHTKALEGAIDLKAARKAPEGHPVHVFEEENRALGSEVEAIRKAITALTEGDLHRDAGEEARGLLGRLNALYDVDKHYQRKENLVFPYLEKRGITGPPTVMWGKHDEIRALLKRALGALQAVATSPEATQKPPTASHLNAVAETLVEPALAGVEDMILKEEKILLPMCLDTLTEAEWYAVARQSVEYGFCLYDPPMDWVPAGLTEEETAEAGGDRQEGRIGLPSGSLTVEQLLGILNTVPVDMTFVDHDDVVRYFTQGAERIFPRSRAILGRKVQLCHPPSSVHMVERILNDFREGRQERAAFWIQLHGKFIHIEYFAIRSPEGRYLGTLEVSQDLTAKRKLEGDRRLLTYEDGSGAKEPQAGGAESGEDSRDASAARGEATKTAQGAAPSATQGAAPSATQGATPAKGDASIRKAADAPEGAPAWARKERVTATLDARPVLASGGHPREAVIGALGALPAEGVLALVTPFVPAPLLELARAEGYLCYTEKESPTLFTTYFTRGQGSANAG